jgi:hypothetical protein
MGSVYRVYDTKVGQMVALEMVVDSGSDKSRDDRRMRFARKIVAINGSPTRTCCTSRSSASMEWLESSAMMGG